MNFLVTKNLAEFISLLNTNETNLLHDKVEKKGYLYIRDRPAMDHLRYKDYKYRKTISLKDEKKHCPFAVAKYPLLRRRRGFAFSLNSSLHILFDPELVFDLSKNYIDHFFLIFTFFLEF